MSFAAAVSDFQGLDPLFVYHALILVMSICDDVSDDESSAAECPLVRPAWETAGPDQYQVS